MWIIANRVAQESADLFTDEETETLPIDGEWRRSLFL